MQLHRGRLGDIRDEGQGRGHCANKDEVVCSIREVAQVVGVYERPLRDDSVCELGVVREHIGRDDRERFKPIGSGNIGANSVRAIHVATVRIQAELVQLTETLMVL